MLLVFLLGSSCSQQKFAFRKTIGVTPNEQLTQHYTHEPMEVQLVPIKPLHTAQLQPAAAHVQQVPVHNKITLAAAKQAYTNTIQPTQHSSSQTLKGTMPLADKQPRLKPTATQTSDKDIIRLFVLGAVLLGAGLLITMLPTVGWIGALIAAVGIVVLLVVLLLFSLEYY